MIRRFTILASLSLALSVFAIGCGDDSRVSRVPNDRPIAVLSVPAAASVGEEVTFDASDSSDTDGVIMEYRFEPGVGSQTIVTADSAVPYVYETSGDYVVTLTVIDDDGGKNAVASTVSIIP